MIFKRGNETILDFEVNSGTYNKTIFNQVLRLAQKTTPSGEQIKWTHPITNESFEVPTNIAVGTGEYTKLDAIVIAMGTNDTEMTKENAFLDYISINYGAYDRKLNMVTGAMWAIESLKILFPNIPIIISTPIQANPTSSRRFVITKNKRDRIVETIGYYGCRLVDSFYRSGFNEKFEKASAEGVFLSDGLHPNAKGKELQGNFMINELKTVLNNI